MCGKYLLEWLDSLITVSLNPAKNDHATVTDEQIKTILSQLADEKMKFQSLLKNHVFGLTKEKQIELCLKQYHSALIILLNQASANSKAIPGKKKALKRLANETITCVDELLAFVETRFSDYLCLDERVPLTYLSVTKKELKPRIDKLNLKLSKQVTDDRLRDIVVNCLFLFIDNNEGNPVTFQELLYTKELLNELEAIEAVEENKSTYSSLDRILNYLNFNNTEYMNYLTQKIANKINTHEDFSKRMDCLLIHFKEFNQMHRKLGIALYPQQADLKDELSNWFSQEIFYLEKKLHFSIVPLKDKVAGIKEKTPVEKEKSKVLCVLSTDQTALILRAADELKILIAKSMNEVFKTIVPHLSTPYKENLSYDSMRSKSYVAETRDKEIAIQTLEKMIKRIKEY
ncbi:MAG: hypothetical protein JSS98_16640 [Bacteroidetes bacterium]|nr:hypothetical protein [Bacteroidota bacterium]